jgi:hypothetical protein
MRWVCSGPLCVVAEYYWCATWYDFDRKRILVAQYWCATNAIRNGEAITLAIMRPIEHLRARISKRESSLVTLAPAAHTDRDEEQPAGEPLTLTLDEPLSRTERIFAHPYLRMSGNNCASLCRATTGQPAVAPWWQRTSWQCRLAVAGRRPAILPILWALSSIRSSG